MSKDKDLNRVVIIVKNDEVMEILNQLPKGVKGMYIEQAILEFSQNKPKIEFFFDGITKPKRKRRSKEEMKNAQALAEVAKSSKQEQMPEKQGKVMFNFGGQK